MLFLLDNKDVYIMAQVGSGLFNLISLVDGNRFCNTKNSIDSLYSYMINYNKTNKRQWTRIDYVTLNIKSKTQTEIKFPKYATFSEAMEHVEKYNLVKHPDLNGNIYLNDGVIMIGTVERNDGGMECYVRNNFVLTPELFKSKLWELL